MALKRGEEYKGITSIIPVNAKKPFLITICPFQRDAAFLKLGQVANEEGNDLNILFYSGDPDEALEAELESVDMQVGPWKVDLGKNLLISTFQPNCTLKENFENAPALNALLQYLRENYIEYKHIKSLEW
jgi:hypothetical protein